MRFFKIRNKFRSRIDSLINVMNVRENTNLSHFRQTKKEDLHYWVTGDDSFRRDKDFQSNQKAHAESWGFHLLIIKMRVMLCSY